MKRPNRRWWRRGPRVCAVWDPPEGIGRDTHVCRLDRGHGDNHECKCGAQWPRPEERPGGPAAHGEVAGADPGAAPTARSAPR